jgi:hypothetical protein
MAGGGDLLFEGVKSFQERGAVGGAAEGEGGQMFQVGLEGARHEGRLKAKG